MFFPLPYMADFIKWLMKLMGGDGPLVTWSWELILQGARLKPTLMLKFTIWGFCLKGNFFHKAKTVRWWFHMFFLNFHPYLGKMNPFWLRGGWNHQLEKWWRRWTPELLELHDIPWLCMFLKPTIFCPNMAGWVGLVLTSFLKKHSSKLL